MEKKIIETKIDQFLYEYKDEAEMALNEGLIIQIVSLLNDDFKNKKLTNYKIEIEADRQKLFISIKNIITGPR
jgi:predicted nucleic-acid-binding protein